MTARKTGLTRRNPAAFGTVQRRGDRFRAFYRRDGETIRAPKTFDTAKAAPSWLAKEAAAHGAGVWIDPRAGADTFGEYADAWLSKGDRLRGATAIRDNVDAVIIARGGSEGFTLSTRLEDDGEMKNGTPAVWRGFRLASVADSAVVVRDAQSVDLDGDAIAAALVDGDAHPIAHVLSHRGDFSDAASQRLRRRLSHLVEAGTVTAEGSSRDRRWRLLVTVF